MRRNGPIALGFHALFVLFILAPIVMVCAVAFTSQGYLSLPVHGASLRWFSAIWRNSDFTSAFAQSLRLAALSSTITVGLAIPAALALARHRFPGREALTLFFMSPLMLPAILTGLALFQSYLLVGIGRPVWGLIMAHTLIAVPYVLRTTLAVLHNFDRRIEEAAAVLGASPLRVFFEVTLPLIRPGVFAGGVFAFIVSFDQFPVSLFLVVPKGETLPVVLFNYMKFDLDGAIAAASMVSILLALAVVLVLERLIGLKAYVKL